MAHGYAADDQEINNSKYMKTIHQTIMPPAQKTSGKNSPSSTAPPSSKGPRLLLLSLAGLTMAVGTALCRLLLSETGTVLLLLSSKNQNSIESSLTEGFKHNYATDEQSLNASMLTNIGEVLVHSSSSPYLRSAPLISLFLSSAAFVVGVIRTWEELRYLRSRCQSQPPFQNLAGCTWNDIVDQLKAAILTWKQTLGQSLEKAVEYVDNMVADDLLRRVVKTGNDVATGVVGGIVLYSIPEDIFPPTPDFLISNKESNALTPTSPMISIRRRVIHTMNPSLGDILFRPGGLWGITPSGLRDSLINLTRITNIGRPSLFCDAPTVDSTTDESGSHDLEEEELVTPHRSLPALIHVRQLQQIVEAAAVPEVGLENAKTGEATQKDADILPQRNNELINKNDSQHRESPPPPQLQIEKILQRTAIAATLCFGLHLHKSPSTRKTWRYAISFFASCGMLSTAVGASLASKVLSSTVKNIASNDNSLCGTICLNTLERITSFQSVHAKTHILVHRFWDEIKTNKRLQLSLAFTVLYGFKRSRSTLKGRPGRRAP
ncbi:hypothetical protein ACHAWX_002254 [Stephanocyclus meneghinianus]